LLARQSEAHCGFGEGLLRFSNLHYGEDPIEAVSKQGTHWTFTPDGIKKKRITWYFFGWKNILTHLLLQLEKIKS